MTWSADGLFDGVAAEGEAVDDSGETPRVGDGLGLVAD